MLFKNDLIIESRVFLERENLQTRAKVEQVYETSRRLYRKVIISFYCNTISPICVQVVKKLYFLIHPRILYRTEAESI